MQKNIFLIQDDPDLCVLLKTLLSKAGYYVIEVRDGDSALKMLQKQDPPCLIITDLLHPFQDGFELITAFRADENWKNVPIIALTKKASNLDRIKTQQVGADIVITLPFDPNELLLDVKRLVNPS